jgi:hypothetical protein
VRDSPSSGVVGNEIGSGTENHAGSSPRSRGGRRISGAAASAVPPGTSVSRTTAGSAVADAATTTISSPRALTPANEV